MNKKSGKIWDFIVIGAGASGMMAALTAAENGARVLLLEQKERIGKKLLATGNGRCNFTNEDMDVSHFHGASDLITDVLSQFTNKDTLSFFHRIGILPKNKNGYYYPVSGQASSVLFALQAALERTGVKILTGEAVQNAGPSPYGFWIETNGHSYKGRKVLFASGLYAAPKLGSNGSAAGVIRKLGHSFTAVAPALCGFYCKGCNFLQLSGVRTEATVTLYIDGEITACDRGELQLTDYGISGIPVFQVSRFASLALLKKQQVQVSLHFLPGMSKEEIVEELNFRIQNRKGEETLLQMLNGMLHEKLIPEIIKKAHLPLKITVSQVTEDNIACIADRIMDFTVDVEKARDYTYAQVCAGGIKSREVDSHTLESRLVPGLFFSGELLDVDGICGGYNLQWAWSSGYVAGIHAAGVE